MNKGERTRETILNRGMLQSSQHGLADITIGSISKLCGLSRTGVISHFENKDDMQIAILDYMKAQFVERIVRPSATDDAFTQLNQLLDLWVDWTARVFTEKQTSCPFIKAIVEYEHRHDSIVRSHVYKQQKELLDYLAWLVEKAKKQGSIQTETLSDEIAFELYSLYVGLTITASIKNEGDNIRTILQRSLLRYRKF